MRRASARRSRGRRRRRRRGRAASPRRSRRPASPVTGTTSGARPSGWRRRSKICARAVVSRSARAVSHCPASRKAGTVSIVERDARGLQARQARHQDGPARVRAGRRGRRARAAPSRGRGWCGRRAVTSGAALRRSGHPVRARLAEGVGLPERRTRRGGRGAASRPVATTRRPGVATAISPSVNVGSAPFGRGTAAARDTARLPGAAATRRHDGRPDRGARRVGRAVRPGEDERVALRLTVKASATRRSPAMRPEADGPDRVRDLDEERAAAVEQRHALGDPRDSRALEIAEQRLARKPPVSGGA